MEANKDNPFWMLQDPELVEERLKYFEERKWDVNEFDELYNEFLGSLGIVSMEHMTLKKGALLYRVRLNSRYALFNDDSDLFTNVNQLGINTKERTRSFGRANIPGQPVFYACINARTAMHEVFQLARLEKRIRILTDKVDDLSSGRVQVGAGPGQGFDGIDLDALSTDFNLRAFTLSTWMVQEDLRVAYYLDKEYIPAEFRKTIEWITKNSEKNLPPSYKVRKSMKLIRDFFIKRFIKQDISSEADYMLSALCTHLVCRVGRVALGNKVYGADGVMYSSVAHGYQGINFAFSEEAIHANKIKFVSAEYLATIATRLESDSEFLSRLGKAECISEETGELKWELFKSKS
jgi:hypothetical protein